MLLAVDLKKPQLEVLLTARHERTDGILSCNTHYQMLTKDNNIKPANGDGACLQVSLKIVPQLQDLHTLLCRLPWTIL